MKWCSTAWSCRIFGAKQDWYLVWRLPKRTAEKGNYKISLLKHFPWKLYGLVISQFELHITSHTNRIYIALEICVRTIFKEVWLDMYLWLQWMWSFTERGVWEEGVVISTIPDARIKDHLGLVWRNLISNLHVCVYIYLLKLLVSFLQISQTIVTWWQFPRIRVEEESL